jgi:hypothetical protein
VINASWGGPAFSNTLYQAVKRAGSLGVLFVAAAGNDGVDADARPEYPAAFDLPNVISVAASDYADRLADFSNYGQRTVDLAAPGDEIYSTVPPSLNGSGYATYSGTSMATPYVSGAAGLYLSAHPQSSVDQVRNALLSSVDVSSAFVGKTVTGGRLDIAKALGPAPAPGPPPPPAQTRDVTPPSPFRLLRPRDRYRGHRRGLRFRWQHSHDSSGIRAYKVFVDGRKRKTLHDPDGPGGRDPRTKTRLRFSGGKHRWTVRAYDWAGNRRTAHRSARSARARSLFFIKPQRR